MSCADLTQNYRVIKYTPSMSVSLICPVYETVH